MFPSFNFSTHSNPHALVSYSLVFKPESFFNLVSSFFLSSLVGMSHVADAPPLCSEMGEGKGGEGPWGRDVTEENVGEEEEEGGVLLCCWTKSTPDRCISSSPARPGGCFKTSSPQHFFPLSTLTRHQKGGSSPDLHKLILLFSASLSCLLRLNLCICRSDVSVWADFFLQLV